MRNAVQQGGRRNERGYAMAGLLVTVAVMGILMSAALPVWSHAAKRERETELIFRGEQYIRAIELYQRQYVGAYPPDLEVLVDQRFLRRLYTDPMAEDGEFRPVYQSQLADLQGGPATADRPGETTERDDSESEPEEPPVRLSDTDREEGGIVGVVSTSEEDSVRIYNGRQKYNEWAFVYTPGATQPGATAGGGGAPGQGTTGGQRSGEERSRFDRGRGGERGGNPGADRGMGTRRQGRAPR